jgi:hypothetical protein
LKSMKVNFNIFAGQHSHHIWTSFKHSGQFWRLEWGTDSHLQHLLSNLKMLFKKNGLNPTRDVLSLYKSIPRRTAAVLKAKVCPTPY